MLLLLCPFLAWADHDLDVFVMSDLFVFDTFSDQLTSRTFNVVVLKDNLELKICGKMKTKPDRNVDAYANYKHFLIVLLWNRVEVYDLRNPKQPVLAKSFSLSEHKPWPGYGRIITNGNKFLVLSTRSTAELTADDDIAKWHVKNLERTEKLHTKTLIKPRFPAFHEGMRESNPFVVKKTERFRYEMWWEQGPWEGDQCSHKKYLRKVRQRNGAAVSSLLLGQIEEMVCNQ